MCYNVKKYGKDINMRYTLDDFVKVMEDLLGENGCPWDKEQTHESLKKYMIEECYEAVEAVDNKDMDNLCEELGDVLLQVVFHSLLAKKEGYFDLEDVISGVSEKMINRHPHVFGNNKAETSDEVLQNWDEIKKKEKKYKSKSDVINKIPKALPTLIRAEKVLKNIQKSEIFKGNLENNIKFLEENVKELEQVKKYNNQELEEKIGIILLNLINISLFLQVNVDFSLTNALKTYINKFEYFENMSAAVGKLNEDTGLEDVDVLKNIFMG